jgi:two-component system, response regulator YesN
MQILLVDDEPYAVDDLAITMPWESLGIETVYKAYSADEALEILRRTPIDIMVTDITMPGMSGIELASVVRRRWKQTKVLLLSGYAEFEYAQQALAHGVSDYLTKPISDEELSRKLMAVIDSIRTEWGVVASYERAVSTFEEHLPLLRNNLLRDLIQGSRFSHEQLVAKLSKLQLPFRDQDRVTLLTIRLEENYHQFTTDDMFLFEYAIDNIARELLGGEFTLWNCKDDFDHLVYAIAPYASESQDYADDSETGTGAEDETETTNEAMYERLALLAEDLQRNVEKYLKDGISIVMSREGCFPRDLPALYQSTITSLRKRIGSDRGYFMTLDKEPEPIDIPALVQLYEPPSFIHLFESGRWQAVRDKLSQVFEELQRKHGDTEEHLREIYCQISTACYYVVHKNGRLLADIAGSELANQLPIRSAAALREWTEAVTHRIQSHLEAEIKDTRKDLIRGVMDYIEAHLDTVTLQAIADHVSLHPVYLSKVYKLETAHSISETIYRKKMERASYMLRDKKLKIYEIASKLGYSNAQYFIKVFKDHSGFTPQEYRDRIE